MENALEDWWNDFARSLRRRNRSDATVKLYRRSFERFWAWADAEAIRPDPAAVTRADINAYTDQMRDTLSPNTVSLYWRQTRPFFSWWADEVDAVSPFKRADVPSAEDDEVEVIDIDDVRKLLATCGGRGFEDRRDQAIIRVLYDTGARLGEMVSLQLAGWDRKNDFLAVTGKSGPRVINLSKSTGEALARYVRARGGHAHGASPAMWLGLKGPLKESAISQLLARRSKQAGLGRINPHRFRHTFAHEFRVAGGSEGDLMYLSGWSSSAMAHRYGKSAAGQRARETHRRLSPGDRL